MTGILQLVRSDHHRFRPGPLSLDTQHALGEYPPGSSAALSHHMHITAPLTHRTTAPASPATTLTSAALTSASDRTVYTTVPAATLAAALPTASVTNPLSPPPPSPASLTAATLAAGRSSRRRLRARHPHNSPEHLHQTLRPHLRHPYHSHDTHPTPPSSLPPIPPPLSPPQYDNMTSPSDRLVLRTALCSLHRCRSTRVCGATA